MATLRNLYFIMEDGGTEEPLVAGTVVFFLKKKITLSGEFPFSAPEHFLQRERKKALYVHGLILNRSD